MAEEDIRMKLCVRTEDFMSFRFMYDGFTGFLMCHLSDRSFTCYYKGKRLNIKSEFSSVPKSVEKEIKKMINAN